jgi:hypothetical protein
MDDKLKLYEENHTLFSRMEEEDLAMELYTWKVFIILSHGMDLFPVFSTA